MHVLLLLGELLLGLLLGDELLGGDLVVDEGGGELGEDALDDGVVGVAVGVGGGAELVEGGARHLVSVDEHEGGLGLAVRDASAHVGDDHVGGDGEDVDAVLLDLGGEGLGELKVEGLGAGVGREEGGGVEGGEGAEADDGAGLLLAHLGEDHLGHAHRRLAVNLNNVEVLLEGDLVEVLGVAVVDADVVDEDGDLKGLELLLELIVGRTSGGLEVELDDLDLNVGVLGLDLSRGVLELALGAGDEADVEAAAGEVLGHGEADAVGGAGDDGPVAGLGVAGLDIELGEVVHLEEHDELEGIVKEVNTADEGEAEGAGARAGGGGDNVRHGWQITDYVMFGWLLPVYRYMYVWPWQSS